jgi:hypothetical protein
MEIKNSPAGGTWFWLLIIRSLKAAFELELELIQTQMAQRPTQRSEVYARALRTIERG